MLKTNWKQHAYMATNNNEGGFTLINMLITLSILIIILPLLSFLLHSTTYSSHYNDLSVQQFYTFLQAEVIAAADFNVNNNELLLELPNNQKISFKQYGQLIQRQVNGMGHEIYLRNIKQFEISPLPYGFVAKVSSLEDDYYEKTIIFYE